MLGDETSGKTSLINRYISDFFNDDQKLTTGVDFYTKTTSYEGRKVKLLFFVFGDEGRFRFLLHQYCKGANGALFLYNITNPRSLDPLPEWTRIIREYAGDIPIMLVGTKAHLEEQRAITREQGIQLAHIHNLSGFIEISSKTGKNIDHLFGAITEKIFKKYLP